MLEDVLAAIAGSTPALALRTSLVAYPVLNAVHILAFATLFGSILVLDLRLVGALRSIPVEALARYVPRIAATGLMLALVTGALLFAVSPQDYAVNRPFQIKLLLVGLGTAHAIFVHRSSDWRRLRAEGSISAGLAVSGAISIVIWVSAILAGRFIAFVE
ncbi:DUF6644 family protein [Jiella marina]|uniref:DUF6644 family protein n=1 Tax=Jiella sp. LLJ827 TaxID=2917712 RepID=UPI002101C851|nr:DUF6644 family protein [Jiella sp. LLJ827]MCQ0987344.1 DUF2214 domain-containing protein [Jiella sp. LLJ827]